MADGMGFIDDGGTAIGHMPSANQPLAISHGSDGDRDRPPAAVADFRDRDAQLAAAERRRRFRCVAGPRKAHDAGKSSVAALDEMKARLAPSAARGFFSRNQNAVAFAE